MRLSGTKDHRTPWLLPEEGLGIVLVTIEYHRGYVNKVISHSRSLLFNSSSKTLARIAYKPSSTLTTIYVDSDRDTERGEETNMRRRASATDLRDLEFRIKQGRQRILRVLGVLIGEK